MKQKARPKKYIKNSPKMKNKQKAKPKRKWVNRVIWSSLILIFITMLGVLAMTLYVKQKLVNLPAVDAQYLKTYEPTRILDNKGQVIWQPTDHRVQTMTYEEIPEMYKTALLAIEDENFWTNKGFSISGVINMLGGVVYSKINPQYIPRGGSTIDQQLIKNRYYNGGEGHKTTTRKVQELFLAKQLDENFTKEEILTFYVNSLSYAEGATGVKAIIQTYLGKHQPIIKRGRRSI
ncbi:transglycosylase domain-containing protein [Enterococcus rivorum]|uniref:transglycosylase domain-containing protein n=1 Tax=Enterococcus rivorum TaxID=762845 RepID=UPI00362C3FF8